jgi:hypothetical protein
MNIQSSNKADQELKCLDPQHQINSYTYANRFCKKCNFSLCPNCALDYHISHSEYFVKVDDFLSKGKDDFMNFLTKCENKILNSSFMMLMGEENKNRKKLLEDYFLSLERDIQGLLNKLNSLTEYSKKIKTKLGSYLDHFISTGNENYQNILKGKLFIK